ncbi:hypothetical protein Peur_044481 [Populus x canadensis]|uniref:BHLH domain-containing protein n=1 Tax=Populus deltoides TaxID=3696 RepID=A0A8T2YM88_POPDE|nr:hypothetical protein H0E87_013190 [Populus deltoides]
MEIIEHIGECQNYWETNWFWNEELNFRHSSATNQQFNLGSNDSSATDGTTSTISSKNIVSERSRRKKLSDKLLALREAVPKISKLYKASIIKDAIDYIQDLQEQEKGLQAEIMELESNRLEEDLGYDFD